MSSTFIIYSLIWMNFDSSSSPFDPQNFEAHCFFFMSFLCFVFLLYTAFQLFLLFRELYIRLCRNICSGFLLGFGSRIFLFPSSDCKIYNRWDAIMGISYKPRVCDQFTTCLGSKRGCEGEMSDCVCVLLKLIWRIFPAETLRWSAQWHRSSYSLARLQEATAAI